MTPSPSVTWPSPAMTTVPLRRTLRTVVERIRRFVGMSAILDYNSGQDVGASARAGPSIVVSGTWHQSKAESAENRDARAQALAPTSRPSLQCDQRHRQQGGENANCFPAREMLVQNDSSQQNSDHGIKRTQHHRSVQAAGLFGADEERGATDVETSGEEGEGGLGWLQTRPRPRRNRTITATITRDATRECTADHKAELSPARSMQMKNPAKPTPARAAMEIPV